MNAEQLVPQKINRRGRRVVVAIRQQCAHEMLGATQLNKGKPQAEPCVLFTQFWFLLRVERLREKLSIEKIADCAV
jgi:hypothetical protein